MPALGDAVAITMIAGAGAGMVLVAQFTWRRLSRAMQRSGLGAKVEGCIIIRIGRIPQAKKPARASADDQLQEKVA